MCPQYFYRLRIMCFYRGDRDIHLIGDFLNSTKTTMA